MKRPTDLDTPHFVDTVIDSLLRKSMQVAYENQLSKQIPVFSTVYLSDITTRILQTYVESGGDNFPKQPQDPEPRALIQDNFMPTSINLTPQTVLMTELPLNKHQASRNTARKRNSSVTGQLLPEQPQKNTKKKPITQISESLIPLDTEVAEEDRIVKFLREKKQTQDKQQSINKQSAKKSSKKEGKDKKPIAVTYDFSGEIINVRGTQPSNLVKNGLEAVINSNIHLNSFKNANTLETVQLNLNQPKVQPVKKKKWAEESEPQQQTQEQEQIMQPLTAIPVETFDVPEGARITTVSGQHNEHSKRTLSTTQLLENYKKIKLSKSEYQRIREYQSKQQQALQIQKQKGKKADSVGKNDKKQEKGKKRSSSVMDLKNTRQRGSKVLVNNEELKDTYLKQVVDEEGTSILHTTIQQKQKQNNTTLNIKDQQVEFLLRRQGTNPAMKTRSILVLPEIKHKLTLNAEPPRLRQRVKNQKQIFGQFHKKFQDRLRFSSIKN